MVDKQGTGEAAERYLDRGCSVLSQRPRDKQPKSLRQATSALLITNSESA
jgi:hypothetical protein